MRDRYTLFYRRRAHMIYVLLTLPLAALLGAYNGARDMIEEHLSWAK